MTAIKSFISGRRLLPITLIKPFSIKIPPVTNLLLVVKIDITNEKMLAPNSGVIYYSTRTIKI